MNKALKIILIVIGVLIALMLIFYLLSGAVFHLWFSNFLGSGQTLKEKCEKNVCDSINADSFSVNEDILYLL